ncbi:MAG: hypothetical protein A3F16_05745 [Deltaproteobacteria bacterium RIFCSPHIGHO2_12_FULL_43_9]|nr:MAG: hypothetical protein A3F16_05745 [Deltaproteobacteria bacterium RIFCSPHIGHO2_12_FULL_43_9]
MPKSMITLTLLLFTSIAYPLPASETLGTFYSSDSGYLKLATYVALNNAGPYQISPSLKSPANLYKLSKAQKICFNVKDLIEFIPKDLPLNEAEAYLPTTEKTTVVPGSIIRSEREGVCYLLQKGERQITEEDFNYALKEAQALFSSFRGIENIPEENQIELTKLWSRGKTVDRKIKRLSKYWKRKIQYTPESLNLLLSYLKENPDKNILQAMFKYNLSDCGPKNFALGVSIWELSKHSVPVRLNYAIWLRPISKDETPLTTDRLHIHVEYLVKSKKWKYEWKTAESAFDTSVYRKIYNK